ncbi:conserved hypothetical protein [Ricinus communis]|uniref:Uncharacterized protein n=1 Tax=Ricinus communis TaxID=3988 RepID=B9T0J4_RICCO|nr:conserved hypothetical protein [Ricinus communis]
MQESSSSMRTTLGNSDSDGADSVALRNMKRNIGTGVITKSMQKKKTAMKFMNLSEFLVSRSSLYPCKEYDKGLCDFHSLGRHRASHNRKKRAEKAAIATMLPKAQPLRKIFGNKIDTAGRCGSSTAAETVAKEKRHASSSIVPLLELRPRDIFCTKSCSST